MMISDAPTPGPVDSLCAGPGLASRDEVRAALLQNVGNSGIFLLDVRDRVEFAKGHVRGALCVPVMEIHKLLPLVPKGRCFLTYGQNAADPKSARAAADLVGRGLPARAMAGGFEDWRTEGLAVHRGGVPPHQVRCSCFTAPVPPPSAVRVG